MTNLRWLGPLALLALAACGSSGVTVPPGFHYAEFPPPMALIEGPSIPPPAHDITEAQRRAWFDAQRPRIEHVRVERTEYVERRPRHYERDYDRYGGWSGWYLPVTFSLGYWGGNNHGWGWGASWNSGWPRGWCW